ncbi:UDP-glucose/GDP-mannose dehydrogenase family protein [Pikeienuella piscinae]|uniref:UDP-glucose 6-dehydrogenase n=1 Tax=Pikeienuella piscinae TaxID=2748098 RepID=A0A7L5BXB8_9RHOB|nr:UDP-glucose/GDP-mannose dehydrogenase family protein [Pikeienuella piscinae]QIE55488.1 UDP-glucose/GDP-mannose dehydrogenase family protein [Pikeienuella piscinae]
MRVAMIGTGYVGLVSGVCFSDFGHEVVCVDQQTEKIDTLNRGETPIYEPGLKALMAKNVDSGRLRFTTDLENAVAAADAVFIAVGTPARRGDGHADLSYVYAAAEEVAAAIDGFTVVITKSTVPVGANREVARRIRAARPDAPVAIVSNPEFLREGAAIEDFMRPDRVVVGLESDRDERARTVMSELYRPLNLRETPMVFTTLESAEITKYAANAFLAAKITFINEIADLCEKTGGDVQAVAKGMGLDNRIGGKFLHAGPGYGGSCFPKDTLALFHTAQELDSPLRIVETVIAVNNARKRRMAEKVIAACDGDVAGRRIAILGVTFKPDTDDMRDAPALVIAPTLIEAGAHVVIADPEGRKEGEALLPGAAWAVDAYDAATGADAVVIITEWNEFRGLDLPRLHALMAGDVMVDLRNIYRPAAAAAAGFAYSSVGRPAAAP